MKQLDGSVDRRRSQLLQVLEIIARACQWLRIDCPIEIEAHKCRGLFREALIEPYHGRILVPPLRPFADKLIYVRIAGRRLAERVSIHDRPQLWRIRKNRGAERAAR